MQEYDLHQCSDPFISADAPPRIGHTNAEYCAPLRHG
jgi:hypothetical protein